MAAEGRRTLQWPIGSGSAANSRRTMAQALCASVGRRSVRRAASGRTPHDRRRRDFRVDPPDSADDADWCARLEPACQWNAQVQGDDASFAWPSRFSVRDCSSSDASHEVGQAEMPVSSGRASSWLAPEAACQNINDTGYYHILRKLNNGDLSFRLSAAP
jgi:hypothetical protein